MKVTVLGCGSSGGVPLIGNQWGTCDPNDKRNRRTRVSVLVEDLDETIVIDTGPDFRQQMLDNDIQKLTAVLYTHAHADHCHGIDELRSVNWMTQKPIDIFADPGTMRELEERFPYIFCGSPQSDNYYKPAVRPHLIGGPFAVGAVPVMPFDQDHGFIKSLGFRFNNFAYSTDVKHFDDAAWKALEGVKVWIVDCVREAPHPTHSHLEQTLEWVARVKPERAYLTHMNHLMDYETILAKLPEGVWPAHDGQVIEC